MKVRLVCVGKPRDTRLGAVHDDYAERIRRLGVPYTSVSVSEVRAGRSYSDDHVREREARAVLEACAGRSTVIVLERTGEPFTSEDLAERIETWATPRADVIVGGPLGAHRILLERADVRWSLSRLTFPHELVRVIAAEQIYRALAIRRGIPYHK